MLLLLGLGSLAMATLAGAQPLGAGFSATLAPRIGLDRLSAWFLLLIVVAGTGSALAALPEGRGGSGRGHAWLGLGFLASMAFLLLARDPLGLLIGWETMSLFPAASILLANRMPEARRNLLVYLGTAHLAGVGIWAGLLYLAGEGTLGGAAITPPLVITALMLVGCAAKAGLVPLHFWLPRAHPLAPAPISALMSGVMIALPFYLLIRFAFEWASPLASGFGYALILAGAASALLGAYSAVMAGEMKRLLAFSSVENMGFAAIALGLAVVLQAAGRLEEAGLALTVCIFGLFAHGLAKSALFIATAPLGRVAGSLELDRLGGLGRSMPALTSAIVVAGLSLAALPPLAGFAAEWALLQVVIQAGGMAGPAGLAVIALSVVIGLAAGFAAVAFCKLIGLGLLGRPRRPELERPGSIGRSSLAAIATPVALLVLIGPAVGWILPWLGDWLAGPMLGLDGHPVAEAAAALKLVGSGSLSLLVLSVVLAVVGGSIWRLRGSGRAAPAPTWICGQPQADRLAWTGAGFAKTLRLSTSFRPGLEREVTGVGPGLEIHHTGEARHPFEWRLHRPVLAFFITVSARFRRLQSGRLRSYLLYLVATLLLALLSFRTGVL